MNKLFIDGGGTSTKVYLTNEINQILEKAVFDGMNIQQGTEKILNNIKNIKQHFFQPYTEVNIGMPGVHEFQEKDKIVKIFEPDTSQVFIITDIEVQEKLFINDVQYYMLCLGSGTILIENNKKEKRFLNGFGPFFQDQGSAFKFAQTFISKALIDWQNQLISNFVICVQKYFKCINLEEIKKIYQNWNDIKPIFLNFTKEVLIKYKDKNKQEIEFILTKIYEDFFTYFKQVKLNIDIKKIYVFGGLFNNEFYKNLFIKKFRLIGLEPIFQD